MTELEMTGYLLKLADYGITGVGIYYEGSGDSGAIECIVYTNVACANLDDVESELDDVWSAERLESIDTSLYSHIQDFAYELLEDVEDWYNDDGGWGTIFIHVSTGKYVINNNIRITHTDYYTHEGNLMDKIKE